MIKAVIFDMDGLIVDSEPIESKSIEILLGRYGKTAVINESGLVHNPGHAGNTYRIIKEVYGINEEVEVLRRRKRRIYTKLIKTGLPVKDGVLKLIELLKKKNLKIALASNRDRKHLKVMLSKVGINNSFEIIVGPSNKRKHKPSPDIYITTARKLKVNPEDCLVLEDSEAGVVAGKEAGMKVIAVPDKYTKSQNFSTADLIVNSLKDIKWSTISSL